MKKVLALVSLAAAFAVTAHADYVIDDFSTGGYTSSITSGSSSDTQFGSMFTGQRDTLFSVTGDAYDQPAQLNIAQGFSGLFVNNGFGTSSDLSLSYGAANQNYSFGGASSIVLDFLGSDSNLSYTINFLSDGATASSYSGVLAATNSPQSMTIALSSFSGLIDVADVNSINIEFNTSTSSDFGLADVKLATTPEPASMALLGLGALGLVARRRRR